MQYTEDEIKTKYNHASDKKEMIQILADLNACDKKTIENIVGVKKVAKSTDKCVTDTKKQDLKIVNQMIKEYCVDCSKKVQVEIKKLETELLDIQKDIDYQKELLKQWNEKIKEL